MNKLKLLGIFSVLLFSFYYVDKVTNVVIGKSNLYKQIESVASMYEVEYVNAKIENNEIIPGLVGKEVNLSSSYYKMKAINKFNDYYLVFNDTIPEISLKDNKDKIIKKGNVLKNEIAFVVDNEVINEYMNNNDIKGNYLVNSENFNKDNKLEPINNDFDNYIKLDKILSKNNLNNELCYYSDKLYGICLNKNKYLISYTKELNQSNLVNLKKTIEAGDIYLITNTAKLEDFKLLVKEISFKGIDMVCISELIKEHRD